MTPVLPGSSDVLSQLVKDFEAAIEATYDSRQLAERDRDYYDNKQWTSDERAVLNKRGQPCITVNRIKPKIDYLLGIERKQRNDPKAYPRTPQDADSADAATDAIRYVLDDNNWDFVRSDLFKNMLLEGIGGCEISAAPHGNIRPDGTSDYRITIKWIPWDRLFYDPHSRREDFSDARYRGQVIWMDEADAREKWPEAVAIFDSTTASEPASDETHGDIPKHRWYDHQRKRVRIVEMWCRHQNKIIQYKFTKAGILEDPKESPYQDEEGFSEDALEFISAFVDRDGNRYGVARAWIDIQDEINKRRSKAVHLMSVRQVRLERGAVEDLEQVRRELAKPDGVLETNPGTEFEILPTGDMAAAQFNLLEHSTNEIDSVGVNAAMSGTEGRVMSGRALIAKAEGGMAELGPIFDALRHLQLRVYRKVWGRVRQYWTAEKWVRVTDDDKTPKYVGLNQPVTVMQQAQELEQAGQPIPPELLQAVQMNPQAIAKVKNNVTELDVDIILSEVPDTAAIQAEQFEKLAGLAQSGVPIPPEALIEASGLRNKDKILEKMNTGGIPPQAQQQIQQAQEQIQAQGQELAQREEQAKVSMQQLKDQQAELEKRAMEVKHAEEILALKQKIAELEIPQIARSAVEKSMPVMQ